MYNGYTRWGFVPIYLFPVVFGLRLRGYSVSSVRPTE
ncbi:hypothetical protein VPHK450_0051 [Vibrio phage K450]